MLISDYVRVLREREEAGAIVSDGDDLDWYKLLMAYWMWSFFNTSNAKVRFTFKCRNKDVRLGEVLNERQIRADIEALCDVRFSAPSLAYLRDHKRPLDGVETFSIGFTRDLLANITHANPVVEFRKDGSIYISVTGPCYTETLWETRIMNVIAARYAQAMMVQKGLTLDECWKIGNARLALKIEMLKRYPGIPFTDFGTRRRLSGAWQAHVDVQLAAALGPQFLGTSNVAHARNLGLTPRGTNAHELQMIMRTLALRDGKSEREAMEYSVVETFRRWLNLFEGNWATFLPDTYSTQFAYAVLPRDLAEQIKDFRHDSGSFEEHTALTNALVARHGFDPTARGSIFSDGVEVMNHMPMIAALETSLMKSVASGTDTTNDVGLPRLSIVVKPEALILEDDTEIKTVKISNNPIKAQGPERDIANILAILADYGAPGKAVACVV